MHNRQKDILAVCIALAIIAIFIFNAEAVRRFLDILIENLETFFDVFRF